MNQVINFYKSSIGKKWIVALTGLVLIAYVLGHLAGNLQIFLPPFWINRYAQSLHSLGPILWIIRFFLLGCFALHIITTILLAAQNRAARPEKYKIPVRIQASSASRAMIASGIIVLVFVIYHLLHLTARATDPRFHVQSAEHPMGLLHDEYDVHTMVILAFQNKAVAGFYLLGVFLLCLHLSHGFSSVLQTLGLNSPKLASNLVSGGRFLAWAIFAGYASIPLAVWLHILKIHP